MKCALALCLSNAAWSCQISIKQFGYVDEIYPTGYDAGMLDGAEVYKVYPDKDVFEPKDDVKGDVARILLYVYFCW